ncbi:MAG TPA: phosphoribosylanthranilate isomerase [Rhodospirillales bacterium]|jgi:phosphoribosylanthranilate isomerase|nr:phosphoribosylanthranilate isomerase [Rhodospirillales bacterium]
MAVDVKICGLRDPVALAAAVDGGARFVGFVFFPPSPRYVEASQVARLARGVPEGVDKVGLVVDAEDDAIGAILNRAPLDMLQLHGSETPARVREVRARFRLPVIKVIDVASALDLTRAHTYEDVADRILFDARAPAGADRPGGNAQPFDWGLLAGRTWRLPWLLAGGLTAESLAEAVRVTGAGALDVSSGVEDRPGVKNPEKIRDFLAAAQRL